MKSLKQLLIEIYNNCEIDQINVCFFLPETNYFLPETNYLNTYYDQMLISKYTQQYHIMEACKCSNEIIIKVFIEFYDLAIYLFIVL